MKNLCLLCLCLLPLSILAEEDPSALQSLDLSSDLTGPDCVATCEANLAACKQRCRDARARADVEHFDEPDVSVSACISDCETDASICKDDC